MRRRAVPLLAASVLGCALHIEPLPLASHLAPLVRGLPLDGARLGVGRFTDERAVPSRREDHPQLRLRGIELARRGDVQTGDESFVGRVSDGFRRDAISTLARSGAFAAVLPLDMDEATARQGVFADVDLVLTASVQEFGAVQYQESVLQPWKVGWLRSRLEDPLGFAKIRYRLHERGGRTRTYPVSVDHVSAGQPINVAALDAMARANEALAQRLYAAWAPETRRQARPISVRVLDACGLDASALERLLGEANEVFGREADLQLKYAVERWRSAPQRAGLVQALASLRDDAPDPRGIVIGLVPRRLLLASMLTPDPFGLATPFGRHAVLRCESDGRVAGVTLIHELAHLFGAVHVRDRSSVMHPVVGFDARFFDPLNHRILSAARGRLFSTPLSRETSQRLRALYTAAAQSSQCCDQADLESALQALDASEAAP